MLSNYSVRKQVGSARALVAAAVLLLTTAGAQSAPAQHEQHGGHDAPAKPQPKKQPAPKKKRPAPKKTQPAAPQAHTQHETQPPQPEQTPQPAPQPLATPRPMPPAHEHRAQPQPTPQPGPQPAQTPAPQPHNQHEHMQHEPAAKPDAGMSPSLAKDAEHGGMDHSGHGRMGGEDSSGLLGMTGNLMGIRVGESETNVMPMGQMGSGTAWQPATSPTYMWHKSVGDWLLMFHGEAKIGVNRQAGPRGRTTFESQNWIMPMAFRRVGRGTLQLRGMFSLEPLTFPEPGSPQLFQTGEVFRGQPIRDAQHPHDLFMELSATYAVPLGERGTWYAYLGYPGEPALGPVAFMHRMSAAENPTAPLAHHLQDSTHISFGVFTTGFTYRWLKLEGSVFNGKEPDDRRYNFEANPWNSRSVRFSVAPTSNLTMQYSYGFLRNPEFFGEGDTHRQTASVQYNRPSERGNWASTLVWGRNREEHEGETFRLNSYLLESTLNFLDRNYLYTRLELVDREAEDLLGHAELHDLGFGEGEHPTFRVGAFTFGGARDLWNTDKVSLAVGSDLTFYSKPDLLSRVYGNNPTSFKIFLRIRPAKMSHGTGQ